MLFFERFWRKALREGVIEKTAFVPVSPELKATGPRAAALPALSAIASKPFEIQFVVDNTMFDGRFSNNGWLQELPDPVTKLVWDNAALLSMETAKKLGVEKTTWCASPCGGKTVDAAVYIQPGMASDTVVLSLGYGRSVRWGTSARAPASTPTPSATARPWATTRRRSARSAASTPIPAMSGSGM